MSTTNRDVVWTLAGTSFSSPCGVTFSFRLQAITVGTSILGLPDRCYIGDGTARWARLTLI